MEPINNINQVRYTSFKAAAPAETVEVKPKEKKTGPR